MWLASVDGVLSPADEARIPIADDGLLRGDGGFEVVRVYGGVPFAWEEHLARLAATCAGLRLEADLVGLRREAEAVLTEAQEPESLLRLVVTRGGRRIAVVEPLPVRGPTARVATITYAPSRVLNGLKTLSYAGNMLAVRLAQEQGYDEALLVTPHGRVLEGPTWTFFWVARGRLHTPPLSEGILDSITRRRVLDAVDVKLEHCTLDRLRERAEEAFAAGTGIEVAPVLGVEGVGEWDKPGPVTLAVQQATRELIERELAEDAASLQAR